MRRTIPVLLTALLAFVAALAVAPSSQAATEGFSRVWDRGPGGERYVALGDSFTSGPGIAPQRPEGCTRSEKNFPSLFAAAVDGQLKGGLNAYTDASCGGATTAELWKPQVQGTRTNPPQLDALGADTTLVTFGTLGGNDVGLVQLATSCFLGNCVPTSGDPYAQKFADLETSLTKGIAEARTRAPHARILVIGYGTYLPPGGCVDVFGGALTVEEFTYVQGQIDRMSDTLARVAKQQEVDFVDMRRIPGSLEHTACAPPNQQWIRALDTYSDGATLHPSGCGMAAMAQHLTRTLQELEGWPLTPFDDSCVSAGPGAPSPSGEPSPSTPTSSTTPSTSPSGSPTGTVTPTATATPSPTVDPKEQQKARRAALRAEAKTLRLNATCRDGRVHVRLRGRVRHVARAVFSVAGELRGIDKTAPWGVELTDAPGTVRGTARAVVTLRDDGVRVRRTVKDATPRCPRR